LAWRLRQDPRVVVLDRTNIRYLESLPEPCDFAVADLAFISLRLALPAIWNLCSQGAQVIALVKPQFEAGREQVGKGGVVRDPAVRQAVVGGLSKWADDAGWRVRGAAESPITGPAGNVEYLLWLTKPGS
jgi:23S rRNA (cytidine1920-2'-O)/16S rRNA (cytidine1409-2'-O)-methyltransferase